MNIKKEFKEALDDVDKMNLPDNIKKKVKDARICACDIIEHLDPLHIDSIDKIESIVNDLLKQHKKPQELHEHLNKGIDAKRILQCCQQEF